ncbi:hypothetical protein ACEPAH_3142 [Sanghuangporus vaninii]
MDLGTQLLPESEPAIGPAPAAGPNAPPQPDPAATRPAVPVMPVHHHSTTKSTYTEHPQESRRAQSALIDQQRETIRHLRNLDEWMSRSVREREDDLQRFASNIEALGNELRDELGHRGITTTGLCPQQKYECLEIDAVLGTQRPLQAAFGQPRRRATRRRA